MNLELYAVALWTVLLVVQGTPIHHRSQCHHVQQMFANHDHHHHTTAAAASMAELCPHTPHSCCQDHASSIVNRIHEDFHGQLQSIQDQLHLESAENKIRIKLASIMNETEVHVKQYFATNSQYLSAVSQMFTFIHALTSPSTHNVTEEQRYRMATLASKVYQAILVGQMEKQNVSRVLPFCVTL